MSEEWKGGYRDFISIYYPEVARLAGIYQKDVEAFRVVVSDTQRKRSLLVGSRNRMSRAYRCMLHKKFAYLDEMVEKLDQPCKFFVFSVEVVRFTNYKSMRRLVSRQINQIITFLKRVTTRRSDLDMLFLRTFETTKAGMLHVNLLCYSLPWLSEDELDHVKKLWAPLSDKAAGVEYKTIRSEQNKQFSRAYVCKYIFKQFRNYYLQGQSRLDGVPESNQDPLPELSRDTIIGWAMGWRTYSMSSAFQYAMESYGEVAAGLGLRFLTNKNSVWTFCCVIKDQREGMVPYDSVYHVHSSEDPGG
jgi:hypothetical protein